MTGVICDFCSSPEPRWAYPTESFRDTDPRFLFDTESLGDWLACDECHYLIEADDWPALADRVLTTIASRITRIPRDVAREEMLRMWDDFRAHRQGPPTELAQ